MNNKIKICLRWDLTFENENSHSLEIGVVHQLIKRARRHHLLCHIHECRVVQKSIQVGHATSSGTSTLRSSSSWTVYTTELRSCSCEWRLDGSILGIKLQTLLISFNCLLIFALAEQSMARIQALNTSCYNAIKSPVPPYPIRLYALLYFGSISVAFFASFTAISWSPCWLYAAALYGDLIFRVQTGSH